VRDVLLRRIAKRRHLHVPSLIADRRVDRGPAPAPDPRPTDDDELVDA
jgi:hypothetical protein